MSEALDEAREFTIEPPKPEYPISFHGPDGAWVMRLTSDGRFEANPDIPTDEAAAALFDAVENIIPSRQAATIQSMREALEKIVKAMPEYAREEDGANVALKIARAALAAGEHQEGQ